ncbi:hypothetical protein ACKFKF_26860 [Phormidesmis sp. 146-12]
MYSSVLILFYQPRLTHPILNDIDTFATIATYEGIRNKMKKRFQTEFSDRC